LLLPPPPRSPPFPYTTLFRSLHRLGLVRALRRDRQRLRVRRLVLRLALERREHRPVEALRALLDHALRLVVALDRHCALAGEERSEERRVGKECRARWVTEHR